jgi:putative addiction module antidote
MITAKIREQGNSYVVTIPREAMEKYDLHKGDTVSFTPQKLETETTYVLSPELQRIADETFEKYREALEYLADR